MDLMGNKFRCRCCNTPYRRLPGPPSRLRDASHFHPKAWAWPEKGEQWTQLTLEIRNAKYRGIILTSYIGGLVDFFGIDIHEQ